MRSWGEAMRPLPMASICCSPPLKVLASWCCRAFKMGKYPKIRSIRSWMALAVVDQVGSQAQVLQHVQVGEKPPPFHDLDDPLADDPVGREMIDSLPLQRRWIPEVSAQKAGDALQGGGFPRPVRSEEGDDLSFPVDRQADPFEGPHVTVLGGRWISAQARSSSFPR